jgi:hypothetical protein
MPGNGRKIRNLETGYWILDIRNWILDIRNWKLDIKNKG